MTFLDPIGSMCRLIALNFRDKNTKISINNIIEIQPPTTGQWVKRYINDDHRDDICMLYEVITKIIEWYLVPLQTYGQKKKPVPPKTPYIIYAAQKEEKKDVKDVKDIKNESRVEVRVEPEAENIAYLKMSDGEAHEFYMYLQKLCKYLCTGLMKLQETYEKGNVVYTLQFYINLINDTLDNRFNTEKLPKKNKSEDTVEFNKIKNLWTCKKVQEICELYDKCIEAQNDKSLTEENILSKIEGYLKAIEHLNTISDEEFKVLSG